MDKTKAQEKAIREKYNKEGEISKEKKPRYDDEGGKGDKKSSGYRTSKDEKEEKGGMDKEGRMKKCPTCGHAMSAKS
jgi:hypothetical protein